MLSDFCPEKSTRSKQSFSEWFFIYLAKLMNQISPGLKNNRMMDLSGINSII